MQNTGVWYQGKVKFSTETLSGLNLSGDPNEVRSPISLLKPGCRSSAYRIDRANA
jgi:hypothetical protein